MVTKSTAVSAWESLFRTQVAVMRRLNNDFRSGEISLTEYDVLFNLSRHPGRALRIRDLVGELLITQPSVSRLVDRLAARGLIEKRADPSDARGVIVAMTDAGFELFRRVAIDHMDSISRNIGEGLDDDEMQQLGALCEKLRAGLS